MAEKRYSNDEITVVWEPGKCIHSTRCWKSLLNVFDPRKRPWINLEGASTEKVIETIQKCPSGALTYFVNGDEPAADESLETKVEALPNGPLIVYGTLRVTDAQGNETVRSKTTAFCRCGQSKTKPYCDGSHVGVDFKDA